MPHIRFAIFDMDGVLYDFDRSTRLHLLEDLTGRSAAEIHEAVFGGPHENEAEAGTPDTAEGYLAQFGRLLGHPIDFETWADVRRKSMRSRPRVFDTVRRLKNHAAVAMLTNNGMMLKAALPDCAPEVVEVFGEKAHVSAEFKTRKPDPLIFRLVCTKYGFAPEESAFVDDSAKNVAGAVEAGLTGHVYRSPDALEAFLSGLDLI
ncbi:HAD family hydrolase [Roseibium aggregatum]|uniref:HAD family phosphatase n=1 Tax=Roseibium aggregatum TaxID=187304 RepID=A0A939EAL7_9HYPH|nr:HAD family phosphatase [Roseibium aggregatum]MBN9669112.1 HAD family phosphatase [Roseibium aggregatum]